MFLTGLRADAMDRSPWGSFFFSPVGFTRGGVRVTPASALGLPTVWSCIKVLAESFAVMPFELYQPKVSGGRTKNRKHWLYRLFAKAPNRFQTPFEFRLMLMGHLALRGNAYCQITDDGRGGVSELLPLHPDRMTVELLDNGSYRYRYIDQNGNVIYYLRTEIWHLRGQSDDGYVGMSPIMLAREAIAEGLAIQQYSSRFFANDARPGGGWIEYPGTFANSKSKQEFRDSWQQLQGGSNRGKVAVLERGMKYHELGLNNKESQFIEARAAKKSEIASIWRVPPHKIGDLSDATYSNIEQQAIEFWTDTMLPYAELWESSIEFFLLGPDEPLGLEAEFDMTRMMRGDSIARKDYIVGLVQAGVLTRNEGREIEGFDPIDGLDEPLRPLNMVEESAADDEIIEGDAGADDATGKQARRRAMARVLEERRMARSADAARLTSMIESAASRLARRAAGALAKKTVAEVFDGDFAALVCQGLCIDADRAAACCAKLRAADDLSEQQIHRILVASATGG